MAAYLTEIVPGVYILSRSARDREKETQREIEKQRETKRQREIETERERVRKRGVTPLTFSFMQFWMMCTETLAPNYGISPFSPPNDPK